MAETSGLLARKRALLDLVDIPSPEGKLIL